MKYPVVRKCFRERGRRNEYLSSHITYPLTARVVGAPQTTSQSVSSIFSLFFIALCDFGNIQACLVPYVVIRSTSFSISLFFFSLSLCLASWFWPDLMCGRHVHTTLVCVSLQWSGSIRVVLLPAGSWHGLSRWLHGHCMSCVVSCGSTSFPFLFLFPRHSTSLISGLFKASIHHQVLSYDRQT